MANRFDYCKFYVIVSFAIIAVIAFVYFIDSQQQLLQFDTIVNQFFKLPNLSLSTTLSATPVVVIKDLNISEQRAFSKICHGQRKQFNWSTFTDQFLLRKQFYNRFDVNNYVPDLQGWTSMSSTFVFYLTKYLERQPNITAIRIIEVGSWKGRSTVEMAQHCIRLVGANRTCTLLAVDTWTGSAEHYEAMDELGVGKQFRDNHGTFNLYDIFVKNIKTSGLHNVVMPLRLSSGAAADVLRCFGLTADFVFIDADHEYRAVLDDMHLYYQLLTPGGVLFGDDLTWPGVARAVPEFLHIYGLKRNYNANLSDATWVIEKPTNDHRLPLFNMHV